MKHLSALNITVGSVLVAGFVGGIAGGAFVLSDHGSAPSESACRTALVAAAHDPGRAPGVPDECKGLSQARIVELANQATLASATVTDFSTAEPTPEPVAAEPTAAPAPAADPAQTTQEAPVASKNETPQQAADRAEKAATRAEEAATKAEQATPTPAPAAAPAAPVATPAPTPIVVDHSYDCPANSKYAHLGATQTRVKNPTVDDCGGPWTAPSDQEKASK